MTGKTTRRVRRIALECSLFVTSALGMASPLGAQNWANPVRFLTEPDSLKSSKNFLVTPFHNPQQTMQSMFLAGPSLDTIVLELFREHALDPRFQIKPHESPQPEIGLVQAATSSQYDFYLGGVRIYRYQVKASMLPSLPPLVFGQMPVAADMRVYTFDEWPDEAEAEARIKQKALADFNIADAATVEKERCYYMFRGELLPVWRLVIRKRLLRYEGVADQDTVYTFFPKFFDIDGTSTIYPDNVQDKATQKFPLTNLATTGRLENDKFKTELWTTSTDSPAISQSHDFTFTPGTSEFDETSLFTNINRHYSWLADNGFDTTGFKQIKVVVHAELSGDVNNALYQPDPTGYNTVYIGDGDGVVLQNLPTDADVISHEFSHHVIYKSITNIDNETSLVLHEGLADTLAFYRTGNACLGESICPKNSALCVSSSCLRTGLNDYTYGGADLPNEAHLKSQFISGMMWDLHIKDNIPMSILAKTVINAITYLPAAASYEHLVIALMYADRALNSGAYCSTIYARAAERGLYSLIKGFGCGDQLSQSSGNSAAITQYPGVMNAFPDAPISSDASPVGSAASSASQSHKKNRYCGSLASLDAAGNPLTLLIWLIPLMYPAVAHLVRRKRANMS